MIKSISLIILIILYINIIKTQIILDKTIIINNYEKYNKTDLNLLNDTLYQSEHIGWSIATYDMNNDTILDILLGDSYDDTKGKDSGNVYILLMNSDGNINNIINLHDIFNINLIHANDLFGYSLCGLLTRDPNEDDISEMAIGVPGDGGNSTSYGAFYMIYFTPELNIKTYYKYSSEEGGLTSVLLNDDKFGSSVTEIGDIDDNGMNDLAIGSIGDDESTYIDRGAIYIILYDPNNNVVEDIKLPGNNEELSNQMNSYDNFGFSISNIGGSLTYSDLDRDDIPDIVVGSPKDDETYEHEGSIYILTLESTGYIKSSTKISSLSGSLTIQLNENDNFGWSVSSFSQNNGDINGDDIPDLLVVTKNNDYNLKLNIGAVYILNLDINGIVLTYSKLDGNDINDNKKGSYFGSSVSSFGMDINNNNKYDIIVGAYNDNQFFIIDLDDINLNDDDNNINDDPISEYSHLIGYAKISQNINGFNGILTQGDNFGSSLHIFEDYNNDGLEDITVGSPHEDNDNGSIYLLYLTSDVTVNTYIKILSTDINVPNNSLFGTSLYSYNENNNIYITVGAPEADNKGTIYLISLSTTGQITTYIDLISSSLTTVNIQLGINGLFGESIAELGDLDNNGANDIIVSQTGSDIFEGTLWMLYLDDITHNIISYDRITSNSTISNNPLPININDDFGKSITTFGINDGNDLNNDNNIEIIVGAPKDDTSCIDCGAIYILFMNSINLISTYTKIYSGSLNFNPLFSAGDNFGIVSSVNGINVDLNKDDIPDLIVGSPYDDDKYLDSGAFYVLYLRTDGNVLTYHKISAYSSILTNLLATNDNFGFSISTFSSDLGNDENIDIVIGSPGDYNNKGSFYILTLNDEYHNEDEIVSSVIILIIAGVIPLAIIFFVGGWWVYKTLQERKAEETERLFELGTTKSDAPSTRSEYNESLR